MLDIQVLREQAARAERVSSFGYSLSVFADLPRGGEAEMETIRRIKVSSPLQGDKVRSTTGRALLATGFQVRKIGEPCHNSVTMHPASGDPFEVFVACFGEVVSVRC